MGLDPFTPAMSLSLQDPYSLYSAKWVAFCISHPKPKHRSCSPEESGNQRDFPRMIFGILDLQSSSAPFTPPPAHGDSEFSQRQWGRFRGKLHCCQGSLLSAKNPSSPPSMGAGVP